MLAGVTKRTFAVFLDEIIRYWLRKVAFHSCKFAQFIPVQIPIVHNGKYPHSEVVICPILLDCFIGL